MDERLFYSESQTTKPAELNCPHCKQTAVYELRWMLRKKKDRLPGNADERDRARFAKAQSYIVLQDDKVACSSLQCRKRFDVSGIKTMAFLSTEQEKELVGQQPERSDRQERRRDNRQDGRQDGRQNNRNRPKQKAGGRGQKPGKRNARQGAKQGARQGEKQGNRQGDKQGNRQGGQQRGNRDEEPNGNRLDYDDNRFNRDDNFGNRFDDNRGNRVGGRRKGQQQNKKKRQEVYFPSDYVKYRP